MKSCRLVSCWKGLNDHFRLLLATENTARGCNKRQHAITVTCINSGPDIGKYYWPSNAKNEMVFFCSCLNTSFLSTVSIATNFTGCRVNNKFGKWIFYISHTSDIAQLAWHVRCVHFVLFSLKSPPAEGCIPHRNMFGHIAQRYGWLHVSSCWTFSWQHIQYKPETSKSKHCKLGLCSSSQEVNTNLYLYTSISQQQLSQVQNTPSPCKSYLYLSLITHHSPWLDWFGRDIDRNKMTEREKGGYVGHQVSQHVIPDTNMSY